MQFVICYLVIYGRMNEMKIITRNIYLIFNYNIHIEIASDQYCLLINTSYNLINYSCILIIFISFKYIKYLFIICSIVSLFIYYLFIFNILRDLLRELDKKYEVLLIIFFLLFGGVLVYIHTFIPESCNLRSLTC